MFIISKQNLTISITNKSKSYTTKNIYEQYNNNK